MIDRAEIRMRCLEVASRDGFSVTDLDTVKIVVDALENLILGPVIADLQETQKISTKRGPAPFATVSGGTLNVTGSLETPTAAPSMHDIYMRRQC